MSLQAKDIPPKLTSSFTPPVSRFQSQISPDPSAEFCSEIGRYALYIHLGCPWAHRTNIVYRLKQLQEIVDLSVVSIHRGGTNGWTYDSTGGSETIDHVEGFHNFREMYEKADPEYEGSYSVPVLWDRKSKTIVNNDSVQIMRILSYSFDEFLAPEMREINKPAGGLRPVSLAGEIDHLGDSIESDVNWGTYKCGMAQTQEDYDLAMELLFVKFEELEGRLEDRKYLFGDHITETDIRLFPTVIRFDMAYYTIFNCNWKQIRHDYPNLHRWLRHIYYEVDCETKDAFRSTTHFEIFMEGYALSAMRMKLVPWGPAVPIMPLDA
ncbi:Glutathione S-transferase (GST), C-terminal [Glarea lozoyensis ATCC 20868]|uniref:Glutathione S-transferase (GST), C-terminal n=1 Tax=Glarea lozoyensis (strain ATCC 20868 / MF5171) TaxID=1116229 RepID=S3CZZ8_GLAL2|nr:Glutathione S-transferase (GST), C-terminal [Glarea lozoyensis ATCC 20868]EPE31180.1 Glutathione S-transferase (GST), C-terminal [Glarea lozoyensis ATCC 20868]